MATEVERVHRLPRIRRFPFSRSVVAAAFSVLVAVPLALFAPPGSPAAAQESVEEIQAEIDRAWRELEPLIEEHNAVRIELEERREEADALAEEVTPLELRVERARADVTDLVTYSYMGGNISAFNALLTSGSAFTFADGLTALGQFARAQQDEMAELRQAIADYETEQAELEELVDDLAETEAELADRADEIDAEIDRLQDLREQAQQDAAASDPPVTNPDGCPVSDPGGSAGTAARFACAQIGKPYGWGSAGPDSYDCSGLTSAAWGQAGVSIPHNAAQQRNATRYIDRSELLPGDLVFYYSGISHVGMYVGGGWIVHAYQSGMPVEMASIDQMPIHSYGRP